MNQQLKLVRDYVKMPFPGGNVLGSPREYYVDEFGKKQGLYIEKDIHNVLTKIGMCKDNEFNGLVTEIHGEGHYATFSYVKGIRQGPFLEVKGNRVKQGVYENNKLKEAETYSYKMLKRNDACISIAEGFHPQIRQRGGR